MTDLLRTSRDGDQFHYFWAARRCLRLLVPRTDFECIVIEGVADSDHGTAPAGEEVVDVSEYFGGPDLAAADTVGYLQLKHSTVQSTREWTASGLKKTLAGFGKKFRSVREIDDSLIDKIQFELVTNRPVSNKVRVAFRQAADHEDPSDASQRALLMRYAGFKSELDFGLFCSRLRLRDAEPGLESLKREFREDLGALLVGETGDLPLRLKELITDRGTSAGGRKGPIRLGDVYAALEVTPEDLFPAPNMITAPDRLVIRDGWAATVSKASQESSKAIVHAAGGIGKSVFASVAGSYLPAGSVTVVYDCYGSGEYSRLSGARHEHHQGLIQIINELAVAGLCEVVVPRSTATPRDVMRVFTQRVQRAAEAVSARSPGAILCLVVDAADNAIMAAERFRTGRSFASDLIAEEMPPGVRLIMLARTERVDSLDAPSDVKSFPLAGMTCQETQAHLATKFDDPSESQAAEFRTQTFGNPRVQAQVINESASVDDALQSLGENPLSEDDALEELLARSLSEVRSGYGIDADSIDRICVALANLRPRIPMKSISSLCQVDVALVESFAADLGRPVLIQGGSVQFRDEPTETWFRESFKLAPRELAAFLEQLRPHADADSYICSVFPQLLWEAGQLDALVDLALGGGVLPTQNPVERAEIAQQRVQFALKAAMREGTRGQIAQLALRAGELTAGNERRLKLFKENTDLAGKFLESQVIEGLLAKRVFKDERPGGLLPFEASLLAASPTNLDTARSRVRSAQAWMEGWVRRPNRDRSDDVQDEDILQVAEALLRTQGAAACVDELSRWTPSTLAFSVGLLLCDRIVDQHSTSGLNELLSAAGRNKYLQLAAFSVAERRGVRLAESPARTAVTRLRQHRNPLKIYANAFGDHEDFVLDAIVGIVSHGMRTGQLPGSEAVRILDMYAPGALSDRAGERYSRPLTTKLKAFALRSAAVGKQLTANELASPRMLRLLAGEEASHDTRDLLEFQSNVVPAITWAKLWRQSVLDEEFDSGAYNEAIAHLQTVRADETPHVLVRTAIDFASLLAARQEDDEVTCLLELSIEKLGSRVGRSSLLKVVDRLSRTGSGPDLAFKLAARMRDEIAQAVEDSGSKTESLVALARATMSLSPSEGQAYFNIAVGTADLLGDEVTHRLESLIRIAAAAAGPEGDDGRAFQLACAVESVEPYLYDGIDYQSVSRTIGRLSVPSALSTASRWQDRNFGLGAATQRGLADVLRSRRDDPGLLVALLPMLPDVSIGETLLASIEQCTTTDRAIQLISAVETIDHQRHHSSEFYERLDAFSDKRGLDLSGTVYSVARRMLAAPLPRTTEYRSSRWNDSPAQQRAGAERRRANKLAVQNLDLASSAGLTEACRVTRAAGWPADTKDIWAAAFEQPRLKWASTIEAFGKIAQLSTFDYKDFLEQFATLDTPPAAAAGAIGELALKAAARFADRIVSEARYEPLPVGLLSSASGREPSEVFGIALSAFGARAEFLTSEACFQVAANAARYLNRSEATDAFDLAIDQLNKLIGHQSVDGEWGSNLSPGVPVERAAAAHVWAGLGDPNVENRWQAAHAVRLLVRLGRESELDALGEYAVNGLPSAFRDQRLPFYEMAAQQMFYRAIARATIDHPRVTARFRTLLIARIDDAEPNVVVREDCKRALQDLHRHGQIELSGKELARLDEVNAPIGEPIEASWLDRRKNRTDGGKRKRVKPNLRRTERLLPLDFEENWTEPLARAFGASPEKVARRVGKIIAKKWHRDEAAIWENDARQKFDAYERDPSSDYRSQHPRIERLAFYLAVQATLRVASELIAEKPVYKEPDNSTDDFAIWLRSVSLTRSDGRWLADRIDPVPADQWSLNSQPTNSGEWPWQITSSDFEEKLREGGSSQVTVWESSSQELGDAAEQVWIRSALVDPQRSKSIAIAIKNAESSNDYQIPSLESHGTIDTGNFRLLGWIIEDGRELGADRLDSAIGAMRFPPPLPGKQFIASMGLEPDMDQRYWRSQHIEGTLMKASAWCDVEERDRGRRVGRDGTRLQLSPEGVKELVRTAELNLLVEVQISRHKYDYSGSKVRFDDENLRWINPYYKVFVFDGDTWWEP